MEWRDIATAPKDGTEILLFVPMNEYMNCPEMEVGYWYDGEWSNSFPNEPSHWIPLPEPPIPTTSEE